MEVLVALGMPQIAPLLAALAFMHLTSTAAVCVRLVAVRAIIVEVSIMRTILPADRTNSAVSFLAVGKAKSAILLLIFRAGR